MIKKSFLPWPAWFSLLEHHPVNRKIMGSIPSQGMCKRQPINVSLSHQCFCFSLPSPLSKSMSMSWSEDKYVFFNIFSACRYREHTTFHGSLSLAWTCCWKAPPILQLLRPPVALALPEAFKNSASALRHTSVQKLGLPLAAIQPHAYYSSLSESKLFICTMGAVRYPTS